VIAQDGRSQWASNVGVRDTRIAGVVMSRNATLVTRNLKNFDDLDIALVIPWKD